jgi:hypothetical protein
MEKEFNHGWTRMDTDPELSASCRAFVSLAFFARNHSGKNVSRSIRRVRRRASEKRPVKKDNVEDGPPRRIAETLLKKYDPPA